jgi:hypothetical protein
MWIKFRGTVFNSDLWKEEDKELGPFEVVATTYDSRQGGNGAVFVVVEGTRFREVPVRDAILVTPLELALTES